MVSAYVTASLSQSWVEESCAFSVPGPTESAVPSAGAAGTEVSKARPGEEHSKKMRKKLGQPWHLVYLIAVL